MNPQEVPNPLSKFFRSMEKLKLDVGYHGEMSVKSFEVCLVDFMETGSTKALEDYAFMFSECAWYISEGFDYHECGDPIDNDEFSRIKDAIDGKLFWIFQDDDKEELLKIATHLNDKYKYEHSKEGLRVRASQYTANKEVRKAVFKEQGKKCLCCGSDKSITLDHIIPVSAGGENKIENLQVLCRSCNSTKRNREISLDELKSIVEARNASKR